MTAFAPAYRLTVYAPKSVDATEATVLTPIVGAAHSDPFVVASIAGVSGAKPYLGIPRGWQGTLDPIKGRTTTGQITVTVQDQALTAGTNAVRWLTAFLGDTGGKSILKGRKAKLEQSTDGGATWAPWYLGRIRDVSLDSRLVLGLTIVDNADDLNRQIFTGAPATSVANYAFLPALMPPGLPKKYGNFLVPSPIKGTLRKFTGGPFTRADGSTFDKGWIDVSTSQSPWQTVSLRDLWDAILAGIPMRLAITVTAGGATGQFRLDLQTDTLPYSGAGQASATFSANGVQHFKFIRLGWIETLPTSDPDYLAMPADGTAITCQVYLDAPPSKQLPLYVNDVHPVQLWADIIDGKFSRLNADGSTRPIAPRDTTTFANLIADTSFGTIRYVADKAWKANDFIEQVICQPFQLGYRLDAQGRVVPLDLRRTSTLAGAITLTDGDLAEGAAPAWDDSTSDIYIAAAVDFFVDTERPVQDLRNSPDTFPSLAAALLVPTPYTIVQVADDPLMLDGKENILRVNAGGFRIHRAAADATSGQNQVDQLQARVQALAATLIAPYTNGAMRTTLPCRRGTNADSVTPGTWCTLTVTALPDPNTNQRGGTRLALCVGRREQGLQIGLDFLDAGPGSIAAVPTVGTPVASAADPTAFDVAVTLNAAGDPVALDYAVTVAGTGSRPGATDPAWIPTDRVTASGTVHVAPVPKGTRIWVRARSIPPRLELPSSYAYPAGTGYCDPGAITAPSALANTNVFGNRVDLGWTVGDSTQNVEVYLTTGTAPGTWTAAMQIASRPPGTAKWRIGFLTPSTQYTVGVRHRDPAGGVSGMATLTFTTPSGTGTAPQPAGLGVAAQ